MIAIVLIILPTVLTAFGAGSVVRDAVGTVAIPFQWCATKVCDAFDGFVGYFTDYNRLVEENESLRQQNQLLLENIGKADSVIDENNYLKEYLGINSPLYKYQMVSASVIGSQATNYSSLYTVNCGSLSGVGSNMPVICGNSLVGYVSEVGMLRCKVTPITDINSSVAVYAPSSGASGMLEGDFSLRADGLCKMVGIDEKSDIKVGDVVVSSGIGSVYPSGILVGRVKEVSVNSYNRTKTAVVEPFADFSSLSHLSVITSYEVTENETE